MSYRVIQWTTGHIGRAAVKGIVRHPELELVGCYAYSEEKDGKDVGELCGIPATGVRATHDANALLAMDADCVCYMPSYIDVDEMVRILESGKNLLCSNITNGNSLGAEVRNRLQAAAEQGGASLFGSGIFPGFANFIAALMATATQDFRKVTFLESGDMSHYDAIHNFANCGWGQPPEEKWTEINETVLGFYSDTIDVMADMLRVPITRKRYDYEYALATVDSEFSGFAIPAGTISGQKCTWTGMVGDEDVIEVNVAWRAGKQLEPDWPVHHGYVMEVIGTPNLRTQVSLSLGDREPFDPTGQITSMPVVNAIPAVCDAPPGIRTYADLPLITGRYVGP